MSILPNLLGLPASAVGLDLAAAARELDSAIHRAGARTIAVPARLGYAQAAFGSRAIAVTMLESDTIARATLAHVRVAPFFGAVVLLVHPRPEIDAPVLVLDLHVVPPGRASVTLDTCGPAVTQPSFRDGFWAPLRRSLGTSTALRSSPVPAWMAVHSGGCGATVRAPSTSANRLVGLSLNYVEAYLAAVAVAPKASDPAGNKARSRDVAASSRRHGKAGPMLARAFGPRVAEETLRLLWND